MHCLPRAIVSSFAVATLTFALRGQELLVVANTGTVQHADLATGTLTPVGPGDLALQALTTDGATFYGLLVATGFDQLVRVDPVTGQVANQVQTAAYVDIAWDEATHSLYGLRTGSSTRSVIERIDPVTGAGTPVAGWTFAFAGPQALTSHHGTLFAWDTFAGLIRVDLAAGIGVAVQPFGNSQPLFLISLLDGRLMLGSRSGPSTVLDIVDPSTVALTRVGQLVNNVARAAVQIGSPRIAFGQGCNDVLGPTNLRLFGTGFAGMTVTSVSDHHALGTLGALILGLGNTNWNGQPLPLLLDPLLGTHGCSLLVSNDASLLGRAPSLPPGELAIEFTLPPQSLGMTLYLQHACFAPVPGFTSWTNGVELTVAR